MREHIYRALTNTCGSNEPSVWVYGAVAKFENVSGEIYTAILPEIDGQNLMCELKRVIPETVCEYTGLTDKNGLTKVFEYDIINKNGLKVGNYYENSNLLEGNAYILIERMGTSKWRSPEQEAIKFGCKYAE